MAVFLTLALFLKYVVPSFVENSEYKRLDAELKPRLAPLHHLISMCENPEDLKLLGDKVSIELSTFCSELNTKNRLMTMSRIHPKSLSVTRTKRLQN